MLLYPAAFQQSRSPTLSSVGRMQELECPLLPHELTQLLTIDETVDGAMYVLHRRRADRVI